MNQIYLLKQFYITLGCVPKFLQKLINQTYGTNYVDLVVCTHPDGDHASGLREIVREMQVGELWMHKPWDHSEDIKHLFKDGRMTENSLSQKLRDAYSYAHELEQIAVSKNIPIKEPFTGLGFLNSTIRVLGPSEGFYQSLIPNFTKTPEAKQSTLFTKALTGIKEAVNWVKETMELETLDESGETSGENNSSTILLLNYQNDNYLFTADTGIPALKEVIDYSKKNFIDLKNLRFMQVPHHGSRRNVSPSVLDEIKATTAYISAAKDSEKHPSKKVINALIRRGARVYSTEGANLWHHRNSPDREGYSSANPHPFYEQVPE